MILAAQVAIADHVEIGDHVILLGRSGVAPGKSLKAGVYFGAPARPVKEGMRALASIPRLPSALKRLAELERQVRKLGEDD